MQLRSDCVFFSLGNTKVIGQGTAPVLSPDDFCVRRAFFTGLGKRERVRTQWRVVGGSSLHNTMEEVVRTISNLAYYHIV